MTRMLHGILFGFGLVSLAGVSLSLLVVKVMAD